MRKSEFCQLQFSKQRQLQTSSALYGFPAIRVQLLLLLRLLLLLVFVGFCCFCRFCWYCSTIVEIQYACVAFKCGFNRNINLQNDFCCWAKVFRLFVCLFDEECAIRYAYYIYCNRLAGNSHCLPASIRNTRITNATLKCIDMFRFLLAYRELKLSILETKFVFFSLAISSDSLALPYVDVAFYSLTSLRAFVQFSSVFRILSNH